MGAALTYHGGGGLSEAAIQALISQAVSDLVAGAPGALDTLNELAAALNDDENFAATVAAQIAAKADATHTHLWADLTDKPAFATVATSGAYGDLSGLPTLGALAALSTVGAPQVDGNAVGNTQLRDSAALSVIGRSAHSSGDPADISAGRDCSKTPSCRISSTKRG